MSKEFNLNLHVDRLLMDEPFFTALSRKVDKRATKAIPTAGVRVNPDTAQFEMIYNPEFFEKLNDVQRKGVLKHEFYHLVFEHVTSRRPSDANSKMWNIATDLAINSHLQGELPENCCMPGTNPFSDYELFLSAEAYMAMLKKDCKNNDNGSGESADDKENSAFCSFIFSNT